MYTKTEVELFHKNLNFMWKKLNTTHYYAKNMSQDSDDLQLAGVNHLPGYSVLSKCNKDPSFMPPESAIKGIVRFYNSNIRPTTDTYQFLNEDLSIRGNIINRTADIRGERFVGLYYCLYPCPIDGISIQGGIIRIYKEETKQKAIAIMGIQNDEAITDQGLLDILEDKPSVKKYKKYFQSQEKYNQRCTYYEGDIEVTYQSLLGIFHEPTEPFKKFVLTLNLTSFPTNKTICDGGTAYLLFTSDGSYDTRFCKAGITNAVNGYISMNDNRVKKVLEYKHISDNGIITLTSGADREWYNLVLEHIKENKKH